MEEEEENEIFIQFLNDNPNCPLPLLLKTRGRSYKGIEFQLKVVMYSCSHETHRFD